MALMRMRVAMFAFVAKLPRNAEFCGEARPYRLKSD